EQSGNLFEEVARSAPEYAKIIPEKGIKSAIRAAAKRTVMAYLYGEGLYCLSEAKLYGNTPWNRALNAGALLAYPEWRVDGRIVCFDGSHLAESFYRRAGYGERKVALSVQKRLAESVPSVLRAQKKILADAEKGYVILPSGRL